MLALLKAVEYEFHARRDSELIEDSEHVISDDSGSTALGFVVCFLALEFFRSGPSTSSSLLFPLTVAALPLLDAMLAALRRLKSRRSPLHGDRAHFYDLLLARGSSPRCVAIVCYGITIAFALIAWLGTRTGPAQSFLISAVGLGALLAMALGLGSLRSDEARAPQKKPSAQLG